MAKKRKKSKSGKALFNRVVRLTGVPSQSIRHELKTLLDRKNVDVNNLNLDELRRVAASYLREIMGGLIEKRHPKRSEQKS